MRYLLLFLCIPCVAAYFGISPPTLELTQGETATIYAFSDKDVVVNATDGLEFFVASDHEKTIIYVTAGSHLGKELITIKPADGRDIIPEAHLPVTIIEKPITATQDNEPNMLPVIVVIAIIGLCVLIWSFRLMLKRFKHC